MIRNIVFDMGQVLIRWSSDLLTAHMGLPESDLRLLTREVFGDTEWVRLDGGTLTKEEAVASVCARLPQRLHDHARFLIRDWWSLPLVPVPGMAELVRELKAGGYGIYLLSNANEDLRQNFSRIPGSEYFDGLLCSAEEKLLKPHVEIYSRLFKKYGLKPESCFFIDDSPANIEGARMAGMAGTVFCGDVGRLRRALGAAGIRCGD